MIMDAAQRREGILELLKQSVQPLSATTIAGQFQVSRQIIVGDIALLRAANVTISATPRGYILLDQNADTDKITHTNRYYNAAVRKNALFPYYPVLNGLQCLRSKCLFNCCVFIW